MRGLMQRHELLISSILEHAARHHGDAEIVSRRADGSLARTRYAALAVRARKLASVLYELGVKLGDRVGTLAMNSDRHLELYYGISGSGAVCNTINPRLSHDDIAYIADHAEDGLIFCDPAFLPILVAVAPKLDKLRAVVVLNASLTDCVFEMARAVTVEEINGLFQSAAAGDLAGILGFEARPLVSADYCNDTRSAIVDGPSTMVTDGTLLKVYAWYDNEVGYACRMVDLANIVIDRADR